VIYGDGGQSRDFTAVDDVVRANLLAAGSAAPVSGKAINVAAGVRTTVKELAVILARILEKEIPPEHVAARPGDVLHSQADATLARELLGWRSGISLEAGLRNAVSPVCGSSRWAKSIQWPGASEE
jgi:nucleoside-diphosphate-sugar epimerase